MCSEDTVGVVAVLPARPAYPLCAITASVSVFSSLSGTATKYLHVAVSKKKSCPAILDQSQPKSNSPGNVPYRQRLASNPGKYDRFSRAIKVRSTTSFGGKVKPSVPCRKILWNVKEPYRQNSRPFLAKLLLLRYLVPLLVTVRELWWMNQEWL
jgi:hypothetical protein